MSGDRKGVEILVGLFLFAGLACIAVMIMTFGSKGRQMRNGYEITVEMPNAEGLIRNSLVMLAGAPIGQVSEPPALIGKSFHVAVKLRIQENVHIPRVASFNIGSSGLMGDKFVNVAVPEDFDPQDVIQPGEQLMGISHGGGFEELTNKGGVVMDQLSAELKRVDAILASLDAKLLSETNLKNLEETLANLKGTTEGLRESSQDLHTVLTKTNATMDTIHVAVSNADTAAQELQGALAEMHKAAESATKTIDTARGLFKKASDGDGTLGTLISDRKMAEDLKALVANLRRSGVLFYKDRPAAGESTPPARH